MLFHSPLLSVLPSGVLDMTADFTPFFVGMMVGLRLCILGLVFAIGVHDTSWTQRTAKQPLDHPVPAPDQSDAA